MGPILVAAEALSNTRALTVSANVRTEFIPFWCRAIPFSLRCGDFSRREAEQAARLENHDYSNRGTDNINTAIDQGTMAAGHVPLMELVSKGIETNKADAPYRLTQPPPKRLLLPETAIDEKGQDSIFRYVGALPEESV